MKRSVEMKGIYFPSPVADEMVRAILEGRKTVTRRVVGIQNVTMSKTVDRVCVTNLVAHFSWSWAEDFAGFDVKKPYRPGDILYVRETWRAWRARLYEAEIHIEFKAGGKGSVLQFQNRKDYDNFFVNWGVGTRWHPSIHMPRDATRIFLRVTDVRVERLQDITPEQAVKEGVVDPKKGRTSSTRKLDK